MINVVVLTLVFHYGFTFWNYLRKTEMARLKNKISNLFKFPAFTWST